MLFGEFRAAQISSTGPCRGLSGGRRLALVDLVSELGPGRGFFECRVAIVFVLVNVSIPHVSYCYVRGDRMLTWTLSQRETP